MCLLARMMAANLYYSQIEDLMFEVPLLRVLVNSFKFFIIFFLLLSLYASLSVMMLVIRYILFTYLLFYQLSMWRCNDELRVRAEELHRSSKRDAKHYIGNFGVIMKLLLTCFPQTYFKTRTF